MSETPPRVAFVTLGCKVNQAESEAIAELLIGGGECSVAADADVVVINTCTVTGEADHKARKAVRHALGLPRSPVVVVTGCLATLDADGLRALGGRVVVEPDKAQVTAQVLESLRRTASGSIAGSITGDITLDSAGATCDIAGDSRDIAGTSTADITADSEGRAVREDTPQGEHRSARTAASGGRAAAGDPARAVSRSGPAARPLSRTRAQLKVEDGCDAFCAYCIVPYARGIPRPVPLEDVVARASQLVRSGVCEIVLTGINIGRYEYNRVPLPDLIEAVAATGIPRIRLSSVEPGDVDDRLLEVAAAAPAFCEHLHIALQSGSDSVLARMGRPYDTASFAETVARARRELSGVAISTDVIAGFPGESDEEAAETVAFVEAIGFSRLHVFRYSARAGTRAASMPGQVAPAARAIRAVELRELGRRQALAFAEARVGCQVELLVERVWPSPPGGRAIASGVTREYLRAEVSAAGAQPGTLLGVTVERAKTDGSVIGRIGR